MVTNHFDKVEMRVYNIAVVIAFSCQTSKKKNGGYIMCFSLSRVVT